MQGCANEGFIDPAVDGTTKAERTLATGSAITTAPTKKQNDYVLGLGEYEEEKLLCGYGTCKPEWLQRCNNPRAFLVWISLCAFARAFAVTGINKVNTSSIERRFQLTSSQAGLISSMYDIAAGIFVLPITFYGTFGHQPRILALATTLLACGSFIMALPHFISGQYELGTTVSDLCSVHGNTTLCEVSGGQSNYQFVLMSGQFLNGIGGITIFTVGIVYIDTNVKTVDFPLYQGIMQAVASLGMAVGYLLGGTLLKIYIDFDTVNMESLLITPDDPRWIGAWWIGFIISGALLAVAAVLLFPFPRIMPEGVRVMQTKTSQAHQDGSEETCSRPGFFTSYRDIPLALKLLVTNPVLMFSTLAAVATGAVVAGYLTFIPKLIQNQFGVTASWAGLLTGIVTVPGTIIGNLIGGGVAKCFKLKVVGILRLLIGLSSASIFISIAFIIHCNPANIAGVTAPYGNMSLESPVAINLTSTCNAACGCTVYEFDPVCGSDGIQYFTPCHAGCQQVNSTADIKSYSECACVMEGMNSTGGMAMSGACDTACSSLPIFLGSYFISTILTMSLFVPATTLYLRCIPENQRAFALGINALLNRLLGTVPGPLLFGWLFDKACLVWQDDCDDSGSCWIYDNTNLAIALVAATIVINLITALFYVLALVFYKPPAEGKLVISSTAVMNKMIKEELCTENTTHPADESIPVNSGETTRL